MCCCTGQATIGKVTRTVIGKVSGKVVGIVTITSGAVRISNLELPPERGTAPLEQPPEYNFFNYSLYSQ